MAHYECKACFQFYCICPAFNKPASTRRKNEPSFQQKCLGIVCLNHRKYRAKAKPRAACEECWRAWIATEDKRRALEADLKPATVTLTSVPPMEVIRAVENAPCMSGSYSCGGTNGLCDECHKWEAEMRRG